MATRRNNRYKPSKTVVVLFVLLLICVIILYVLYCRGTFDFLFAPEEEPKITVRALDEVDNEDIISSDVSIHFLELGNANTGDSVLIKSGNTELLIDAGSKENSTETVKAYINSYCTDGKLEYVIATHAHEDHIAGLVGSSATHNGVLYSYEIGTILQFARTNQSLTTKAGNPTLYAEYLDAVEYAVGQGAIVYNALQCWNETDGAKKSYALSDNVSFDILYQKYYGENSSRENNYSVCILLKEGTHRYLFTGDLEKAGEKSLVQNNSLPKCDLYKAGHHGSNTSSCTELLEVIRPDVVCVCCCCGNMEYAKDPLNDFPSQAFTDNVAKYTERIYVTTIYDETAKNNFRSMNGTIVVFLKDGGIVVACSANTTVFKDTEWFKKNRTWNPSK